jgi:ABC-type dipeptide/oligopeptide/nickel transport system permease subunit
MKNTIRQVFHSSKFVVGFAIFATILLTMLIYPMINPGDPLKMIGLGTFAKPGTYVSLYDSVGTKASTFTLPEADANRLAQVLTGEDRVSMVNWFSAAGVDITGLNIQDTEAMLTLWKANYDKSVRLKGMTKAMRNYYERLNNSILSANNSEKLTVSEPDETGALTEKSQIAKTDYVNVADVANVKTLPLGTDNFGADTLKKLVSACGTSIRIGLIAGAIATLIGLILGLLGGYLGGLVDELVMFVTNLFTFIPSWLNWNDEVKFFSSMSQS